jgi:hypothetical protein
MQQEQLIRKIRDKSAVVAIIGVGYIGLPLMLRFSETGFRVIGHDIDAVKIDKLNRGESYIRHIQAISAAWENGFSATSDFSRLREADAIIICVPTPLNKCREPDMSFVLDTTDAILPHLRVGQIVCLESTTYPGTTDEELKQQIESTRLKVGTDLYLVFSREREDRANAQYVTKTNPKVCGGTTPACLEAGTALYGAVIDRVVPVSSKCTTEIVELLEILKQVPNLYQRVARRSCLSEDPKKFTFLANAGAVAILWFSGSLLVVASSMVLILGSLIITEMVAQCDSGDSFLLAITGAGLANVTSQMTFPYLSMIFLLQLWVAIAVIPLIQRVDSFPLFRRRQDAVPD